VPCRIFCFGCFLKKSKSPLPSAGLCPQKEFLFFLFAPFNFLLSETEKKLQLQKNQKVTKICQKKSISLPSDDPWFVFYESAKPFFFTAFQNELIGRS